jgi:SpoVK/Ycf46/Vps4 family AAA+-type ATPase
MYGPPGTGKTKIAKALATEIDWNFFSVGGADLVSCYFGGSEKLVKQLFEQAAAKAPCVIFFGKMQSVSYINSTQDEMDSLCRARSDQEDEHTRRLKNEIIKNLDGISNSEAKKIVVLGSTNRSLSLVLTCRAMGA